ncbi:MAG: bacteriohemerythrin [Thiohalomonadaceae bacterium]
MPTMITWSDEFSVDIQEIDEQHKKLVGLINALYVALASKDQVTKVETVLDELVDYTRTHFAVEECLLRLFEYEGYEEHKAIHDKIVERVLRFQAQFKAGEQKVGMELLYFLKDWLMDHINKVDKRYAPHLTSRGVKKTWLRKFF